MFPLKRMGFTMSRRCVRCNLWIEDEAIKCPLCHGVLENATEKESKSITYPDVSESLRKMQFIIRLVIFLSIVAEMTVIIINYLTFKGVYWSAIVGVELVYGCFVLAYSFQKRKSIQRLIQGQMYATIIVLILTDLLIGWQSWSIAYALPITFMAVDVCAVVLMIIQIDGWQNYIMTEIVTFILSLIVVIIGFKEEMRFGTRLLEYAAVLTTFVILLGTILLGGRMISNELKRRFRV